MWRDLVLLDDLVVDRQHRAARIAEDVLDALVDQRLDDHLRARHLPAPLHRSVSQSVRLHAAHRASASSTPCPVTLPFRQQKRPRRACSRAPPFATAVRPSRRRAPEYERSAAFLSSDRCADSPATPVDLDLARSAEHRGKPCQRARRSTTGRRRGQSAIWLRNHVIWRLA